MWKSIRKQLLLLIMQNITIWKESKTHGIAIS